MPKTGKMRKPMAGRLNLELPYDHFGAELFCTFYAASVRQKPLREFSTDEWLDLMRLLYTLWQRGTGYEEALNDIGVAAKLARKQSRKKKPKAPPPRRVRKSGP